ncbi:hypothetical protein GCM10010869_06970 [Mesorhizobium tianshanense]|nr:hypothetical protein GCM10010869_06970 [Mesorhizobium tianshanense]
MVTGHADEFRYAAGAADQRHVLFLARPFPAVRGKSDQPKPFLVARRELLDFVRSANKRADGRIMGAVC